MREDPVARAIRWAGWVAPLVLFRFYFGLPLLDIRKVYPYLDEDWAAYATTPNFARHAPALSFPIGRLDDLLHPVGTYLGQGDASPALYPLYRILGAALPDRPFQLIGWQVLLSMVATFGVSRYYLRGEIDRATDGARDPRLVELLATAGAATLIAQPFFVERRIHVALFNVWVIVWALIAVGRILEARRAVTLDGEPADGPPRPTTASAVSVLAFVAPAAVAALLMPYLALLVLPVLCLPLVLTARADPRGTIVYIAGAGIVAALITWVLGFIGTGGRTDGGGYGLFSVDLAFLIDSKRLSRVWPDVPASYTHEGLGFLGTPLLLLAPVALVATLAGLGAVRRPHLRPVWITAGLMFAYATLPVIRFARRDLLDLTAVTDHFGWITGVTRSNGRFAWPLLWMTGLAALRWAALLRPVAAVAVVGTVTVFQLADSKPPPRLEVIDHGAEADAVVRQAIAAGATRVEFQPPFIASDCASGAWDGRFERIAPVAVAAAVHGLPINSGYPSRGDDRYFDVICHDQAREFIVGHYLPDVLYVVPPGGEPTNGLLDCQPTDMRMSACRTVPGYVPDWEPLP